MDFANYQAMQDKELFNFKNFVKKPQIIMRLLCWVSLPNFGFNVKLLMLLLCYFFKLFTLLKSLGVLNFLTLHCKTTVCLKNHVVTP